jgi:SNW domain-containing protein 1
VAKTAKETMEALNRRVTNKLAVQNPSTLPEQPGAPTYIKYTPSQQGAQYASGAKQRIIKMQDMPIDPLEPPKFRHTKVPRGTGSPPVPVMHSPPRPVTAEDQANWKIPPCISNWKNAKGYTIPLDKRLAADGRGLQVRLGKQGRGLAGDRWVEVWERSRRGLLVYGIGRDAVC